MCRRARGGGPPEFRDWDAQRRSAWGWKGDGTLTWARGKACGRVRAGREFNAHSTPYASSHGLHLRLDVRHGHGRVGLDVVVGPVALT